MNKQIIIINPPNNKIVLRDFYSSTISKGKYNWPNTDLLSISAILGQDFETQLIDANTMGYNIEETFSEVLKHNNIAGAVVAVGKSVLKEDYDFIEKLRILLNNKYPSSKISVVGGIIYHNALNEIQKNKFIDACILNFTTNDILNYYLGNFKDINNIIYRQNDEIVETELKLPEWGFKLPIPKHEQLPLGKYQLSHGKNRPLTSVITSYGCPHKCSFCVSGRIKYRYRDPQNIIDEIKYLISIGIKEITFRDNIFGFHKQKYMELLNGIIENNLKFSWVSDSRVDILDEELIMLMSKAGCHALHFGIETNNEDTLNTYNKNLKDQDYVKSTLELCRKYKIQSVGYFILGLPGEKYEDVNRTINYSVKIGCDYASFNLPLPIIGTDLRESSMKEGLVKETDGSYDGSSEPLIKNKDISSIELINLQKKAYRKFYFRLSFIIDKIKKIRTFFQLKMLLSEGYYLLLNRR